jgi:OFA family oxalate/formate antiporter-like MFS transporter
MNKIIRGIIPALLITLPIGSVYAFSLFSTDISTYINCSFKEIQFAFSLSIFFLGMGAAFGGSIVEKNINKSALLASGLFCMGLIITSIGISLHNIWFIYVGYGFLCGIAQGIGYLTPVKTLLMWFPKNKGLATSISIISFGLGSGLCTILHNYIYPYTGINNIFYVLSVIYFLMMVIGAILIKKPYIEQKTSISNTNFNYKIIFKDKFFINIENMFKPFSMAFDANLIDNILISEVTTEKNVKIMIKQLRKDLYEKSFKKSIKPNREDLRNF